MSTPIRSPVRTCSRSSSGTDGSAAVSPGMFRPWREATAPPISTTASISPLVGAHVRHAQADGAVGEVHDLVAVDGRGQAGVGDVQPRRVALAARRGRRRTSSSSPGLNSTTPSRSLPMRSFGPGQVLQDRDLAAGATGGFADEARGLRVLVGAAVGEVQAGHVHPGLDHAGEDLGIT